MLFLYSLFFATALHAAPQALPATTATPPSSHQAALSHAMLTLAGHQLDVRLAMDNASREQGLMKQSSLGANEGMLFVFPRAQQVSFWMKDTPLPLSIAYIANNGKILEIHDLEPFDEHSILSSSRAVLYALEVPRGWFSQQHVLAGDVVSGLPSSGSAE
jgi:uncharacterized membrane protein (UPF0127 family)